MNRAYIATLIALVLLLTNCSQPTPVTNATANKGKAFKQMLASYWKDRMAIFPLDATSFGYMEHDAEFQNTATQSYRTALAVFYQKYSDSLAAYNISEIDAADTITYKVFAYDLGIEQEKATYDDWKIPFTQMGDAGNTLSGNLVLAMAQFGSGKSAQPFKTVADYENWLKRVNGYLQWNDSAINNFRQGIATGYVLPKALVVKMIDICDGLVKADVTTNIYYGPVKNMPANFTQVDKDSITARYTNIIKNGLDVAHKKMSAFLKNEYLPKARTTSGVNALPNGEAYYKFCVKNWTTTNKTLDEIYNTGLSEVARIHKEMETIKASTGFKGDLNAFFEFMKTDKQFMPFKKPQEVLDSFNHIYAIIQPALKKYFALFPKSKFEIRLTEAFRAASASAEYLQGAPDGSRPGVFYIPILDATTFNVTSGMESLFLHEAIPGHHFQGSLQMEDTTLSEFMRFKYYGAYGEGWALYCESLGKELGLYTNPYQHMGALGDEIHRAIRLVVDVAIHTKNMSREEAIKYMMSNEAISEQSATAEIERYMSMPGQALSYKIGALKIRELREACAKASGDKFSIAAFHKEVLNSGCLPLVVLGDKIHAWCSVIVAR